MIEILAKAIAEADGDHTVMDHHRRRARAAIEAIEADGYVIVTKAEWDNLHDAAM